jgi:subtilisin family serine protease
MKKYKGIVKMKMANGRRALLATALVLASGSAAAVEARPDGVSAQPDAVRASAAQRRSAEASFAWLARDAGLLDRALPITATFRASPGLKERSGRMVAKVRDRGDMARAAAAELSAGAAGGTGVARAAAQPGFGAIWARADDRIAEARARLAPATVESHDDIDIHSFVLPAGWTEEEVAAALMATGDYEFVEPDWLVYPTDTTPNDPQFGQQWHHRSQNMNTVLAWDYVTGGSDVIVAVCDTGVRKSHADLVDFVPGFNATTNLAEVDGGNTDDALNGHGTQVAGCMAARGNNGIGVAGVGWNFKIMPIRVSDRSDGTALLSDILQGARWAAENGAYGVNCSYGGANSSQANSAGGYIRNQGGLLVFSSGNDGAQDQTVDRPFVTIVGATNSGNSVVGFSNYGVGIDVVAPGSGIRTTTRTGGYTNATGTSFSAPLTAAVLSLIHDADPTLTPDQVEQILKDTARDIGAFGFDIFAGHGLVDAGAAVETALFGPSIIDLPFTDDFGTGVLSNLWRQPIGSVNVNADAADLDPGDFALNLSGTDGITTVGFRAGFIASGVGEIAFDVQHRGVEAGESLLVEYLDILGAWSPLTTIVSDGVDEDSFSRVRIAMPLFAKYDGLKVRFRAQGSDATDDWYIDDVLVDEFVRNDIPWGTSFEDGIDTDFDWAVSQGTATSDAPNTPDGTMSARLTGTNLMESRPVDITTVTTTPYVRVRTLHTGVESGESLEVEYRDIFGGWQTLSSIVSDGTDETVFTLHQFLLPFDAFGPDLAVRFVADGSDGSDVWYIDDVAITEEFVVDPPTCPQDIDGNGLLNFFDISGFLSLFNSQDPSADWDNNGQYNFFDISSYLASFNAGCP